MLALARASLPFELTGGQEAALEDLLAQMAGWPPMQCLLQGDVGCGKTVVALLALLAAAGSGYQGALMAPTEILADQHFRSLQRLVQDMTREAGRRGETGFRQPRITLVTGSVTGKARRQINEQLENGEIDIAVGTHALISDSTQFKQLGLAVVDEQHKFGVEQRGRLLAKASPAPHVLHMTATPIPRTQALIDHGDMSLVLIQELPAGRSPVVTRALRDDRPEEREQMYAHIREEMAKGHGIYIVCPFVEQSDKMEEVKAATQELERLIEEGVFDRADCGLLHGQMAPVDKDAVLARFKAGHIKLLVSTTVVEVGVDVPQATVMVVEHAQRFGFAQLHQLRGRVGRSDRQSYCYLVYDGGDGVRQKMKVG
jgi:ATP-dependent DNA helicase RecG